MDKSENYEIDNKVIDFSSQVIVIDLEHYNCPKLFARKTWEALFRAVNAGTEFLSFDNFLIDYTAFSELFDKAITEKYRVGLKSYSFYWEYEEKGRYTRIYYDDYPEFGILDPFYKITLDLEREEIRLEKKENAAL